MKLMRVSLILVNNVIKRIYLLKKRVNNLVLLLFLSIKKDKEAIIFPRVWELLERAVMCNGNSTESKPGW
jgi:hypothetical protein